eukprot:TRINITY_DN25504_c0_g1_i1.p1 TRINITY_DN25504_c0_g1~~TRINITY_DN25504_c0_g1_i1.p1  ORF type:complete len:257 (+),score=48.97 TRINITY_DN25504_c0_g1_i1:47-817(+)
MVRVPPPTLNTPPAAKMAGKRGGMTKVRPSLSQSMVKTRRSFKIAEDDDSETYLTSLDLRDIRKTPQTALRTIEMNADSTCCRSDITIAPCSELRPSASQLSEADRMIYETPVPRFSPVKDIRTVRTSVSRRSVTNDLSREGWLTEGETIAVALAAEDRESPSEVFLLGKVRSVGRDVAHVAWRQQIWRSGRLTGLFKRSRYTQGRIEYSNRHSIIMRDVALLPLDHSPTGAKWLMYPEEYDKCRRKVLSLESHDL